MNVITTTNHLHQRKIRALGADGSSLTLSYPTLKRVRDAEYSGLQVCDEIPDINAFIVADQLHMLTGDYSKRLIGGRQGTDIVWMEVAP